GKLRIHPQPLGLRRHRTRQLTGDTDSRQGAKIKIQEAHYLDSHLHRKSSRQEPENIRVPLYSHIHQENFRSHKTTPQQASNANSAFLLN
ncbi:MAG: hypothetical protein ACRDHZ_23685, partial [Ktedonobacteraceae bacterium]